jgi:hypothetical protein
MMVLFRILPSRAGEKAHTRWGTQHSTADGKKGEKGRRGRDDHVNRDAASRDPARSGWIKAVLDVFFFILVIKHAVAAAAAAIG